MIHEVQCLATFLVTWFSSSFDMGRMLRTRLGKKTNRITFVEFLGNNWIYKNVLSLPLGMILLFVNRLRVNHAFFLFHLKPKLNHSKITTRKFEKMWLPFFFHCAIHLDIFLYSSYDSDLMFDQSFKSQKLSICLLLGKTTTFGQLSPIADRSNSHAVNNGRSSPNHGAESNGSVMSTSDPGSSELSQLRLKLEQKRKEIERKKHRQEAQQNKMRQRLGECWKLYIAGRVSAFIQLIQTCSVINLSIYSGDQHPIPPICDVICEFFLSLSLFKKINKIQI